MGGVFCVRSGGEVSGSRSKGGGLIHILYR
jgi:hypothetical protein